LRKGRSEHGVRPAARIKGPVIGFRSTFCRVPRQ